MSDVSMDDTVMKHTQTTLRDAVIITFVMIAALLAAEGRMPDLSRIFKFILVYVGLVSMLKLNHESVANQIMTASAIGCGSKLLEVISKP